MTAVDWIALAFVGLVALAGLRRGLIASALSLAGIVVGAIVGARVAPHLLPDGSRSPYTPLAGLAGAAVLALLLEALGSFVGAVLRRGLRLGPLRAVDSAGGLALGAATGLAVVWIIGTAALQLPGRTQLRDDALNSEVLRALTTVVPPRRVLRALARIDPLPAIAGPFAPVEPPDPRLLRDPAVRAAARSVVRVVGTACGVGTAGSGWVAAPRLVVTAAHVVAGQRDTVVEARGGAGTLDADVVAFDVRNDLAVLRVPGLTARPLATDDPSPGTSVAILGYPENGSFTVTAGRIGRTSAVFTEDAYERGPVWRTVTTFRGDVRPGNSGGPAVDSRGAVRTTVFAGRVGSEAGYGVPTAIVRRALARAPGPVSTGDCVS